jgi:hypothetical protein
MIAQEEEYVWFETSPAADFKRYFLPTIFCHPFSRSRSLCIRPCVVDLRVTKQVAATSLDESRVHFRQIETTKSKSDACSMHRWLFRIYPKWV